MNHNQNAPIGNPASTTIHPFASPKLLLFFLMFTYISRDRETVSREGAERQEDAEFEAGSRL